jgi:hypothetical protein
MAPGIGLILIYPLSRISDNRSISEESETLGFRKTITVSYWERMKYQCHSELFVGNNMAWKMVLFMLAMT